MHILIVFFQKLIELLQNLLAKVNMTMDMARELKQKAQNYINDTRQNIEVPLNLLLITHY